MIFNKGDKAIQWCQGGHMKKTEVGPEYIKNFYKSSSRIYKEFLQLSKKTTLLKNV